MRFAAVEVSRLLLSPIMRPRLTLILAVVFGLVLGVGVFTFGYARGASYLTDDPSACANCHVMQEQFSGWMKSSHRAAAVCNDCHTPSGFVPKYAVKALNGFMHSFAFTTGWFPDHIRTKSYNLAVARAACAKCHAGILDRDSVNCLACHRTVGHP